MENKVQIEDFIDPDDEKKDDLLSLDDETPLPGGVCNLDEGCESCQ